MSSKTANSLVNESSTYLLQHAYNPVQWQAWTKKALEEAIAKDKPILLSIGYSACHWCHVMEEESFEDDETAKLINEYFIPIKVDREERPDIDDIYMSAVQLMTGHGGWPLTVFLTPEQKPFYGGTYFPKEDRQYGQNILPGFKTLLKAISHAWNTEKNQARASAEKITQTIAAISQRKIKTTDKPLSDPVNLLINCANKLLPQFDLQWGGFAGAPKFPQTMCLQLCLQAAIQLKQQGQEQKANSFLEAVRTSLDGMSNGGIYDHLGGGFARYSTDEKWLIPHFEKMLYDNALLADLYFDAFTFTNKSQWLNVGTETLDFIIRELTNNQGGLYCALDADSQGVEGKFYVWQKEEIEKILQSNAESFCQIFGVTASGNFEEHNNVLFLNQQAAKNTNKSTIENNLELSKQKALLFDYRAKRIHPTRDEKILTSWSSLGICAFVRGYRVSGETKYLIQARQTANFILNRLIDNGRLMHSFAKEQAKLPGYLDDYSFFIQALIDLASVDDNPKWLNQALICADTMIDHFFVKNENDFFYTADDQEKLITRPKLSNDGALPSSAAVATSNLLKLEILTNDSSYKQVAQTIISKYQNAFYDHPSQYASLISASNFAQSDTISIILVTTGNSAKDNEMLFAIHSIYYPNKVVVVKNSQQTDLFDKRLLILDDKQLINNQPTVYICQGRTCLPPSNDIEKLKTQLKYY